MLMNLLQHISIRIANCVESKAEPSKHIDLNPARTFVLKDYINYSFVYPCMNYGIYFLIIGQKIVWIIVRCPQRL